jgi:hypothetical protein
MTWVLILWCVFIIVLMGGTELAYHKQPTGQDSFGRYHIHVDTECGHECRRMSDWLDASAIEADLIVGAVGLIVLGVLWFVTFKDDTQPSGEPMETL